MSDYYYPEGILGPVCDVVRSDDFTGPPERRRIVDDGDGREYIYGPIDFDELESVIGPGVIPAIIGRRCKVRILEDGTKEFYDCQDDFLNDIPLGDSGLGYDDYNWKNNSLNPFGLDDNLTTPNINVKSCSPFDPDINIIPTRFFNTDGTFYDQTQVERSSPPTFNVTSENQTFVNPSTVTAVFSADRQNLVIGGTGEGIVQLELDWNDNVSTSGQSVGTLTVAGASFSQGNKERGTKSRSVQVTAGQSYPISLNGNSSGSGSRLQSYTDADGNTTTVNTVIEYDDDIAESGFDINATFRVTDILPLEPTTSVAGYWSDEGNEYAVWVNPAVCTLPFEQQVVTYQVPIPETGTYGFEFASDDSAQLFIGDSEVPLISGVGGIFASGSNSTPFTTTTTLNAGTVQMVVRCTNSAAGFQDANNVPFGDAYNWLRNPGGWYLKICQGGGCVSPSNIQWMKAGPHPAWSDFMNTYAVYPDNQDTLSGVAHTANYNISLVETGNYELKVQADNTADFTFDGTSLGTHAGFNTNVTTYTLNSVVSGGHTLQAVVTNAPNSGDPDVWSKNPGGVAWTLTKLSTLSNISAKFNNSGALVVSGTGQGTITLNYAWDETPQYSSASVSAVFNSSGNLVVTGSGSAQIELEFEWDDNPSTAGSALGNLTWTGLSGVSFTQTSGVSRGEVNTTSTITAGQTYNINITNGNGYGGFAVENNGEKLCFRDLDGDDCNAKVKIKNINQDQTEIASDNALTSYSVGGYTFNTGSANTGTLSTALNVTAGTTYPATIVGNPYGFTLKQSKTKLCFQDSVGANCNASVTIGGSANGNTDAVVASSLDLNTPGDGNIIWHTRLASGYAYINI